MRSSECHRETDAISDTLGNQYEPDDDFCVPHRMYLKRWIGILGALC